MGTPEGWSLPPRATMASPSPTPAGCSALALWWCCGERQRAEGAGDARAGRGARLPRPGVRGGRQHAEALAREQGARYVHPANEPLLIAGVATETLEIIEDFPQVEVIRVPLGGGSGAAGAYIAAKALKPAIQVIAVQSEQAPAAYRSWKERRLVEGPMSTFAEGLATSQAYQLTQAILWDLLDDFLLVSDAEIRQAIGVLIERRPTRWPRARAPRAWPAP